MYTLSRLNWEEVLDKMTESDSILNFTTLFLDIMKAITGAQKKHNALWNILTGVRLSTAGAAVQISDSFPPLLY